MTTPVISDMTFTDILRDPEGAVAVLSTDETKRILMETILAYLDNVIDHSILQRVGETLQNGLIDQQTKTALEKLARLSVCPEKHCPMDTSKDTVRGVLEGLII